MTISTATGLRPTNEDKRRAVMTLLNDAEWAKWSDREIAERCGVTHPFVATLRPKPSLETVTSDKSPRTFTSKHGTVTTMKTENIGNLIDESPDSLPDLKELALG